MRIISQVVEHSVDIEAKDYQGKGNTALHRAAHHNWEEFVYTFLDCDANIEAVNYAGKTPLWCALSSSNLNMVEALVSRGVDVEAAKQNSHVWDDYSALRSLKGRS